METRILPVDAARLGTFEFSAPDAPPANVYPTPNPLRKKAKPAPRNPWLAPWRLTLRDDTADAANLREAVAHLVPRRGSGAAHKSKSSSSSNGGGGVGGVGSGQPVAFPTETVYGLGADATSSAAVRGIYRAKGRPADNPLIVHVCSLDQLRRLLLGRGRGQGRAPKTARHGATATRRRGERAEEEKQPQQQQQQQQQQQRHDIRLNGDSVARLTHERGEDGDARPGLEARKEGRADEKEADSEDEDDDDDDDPIPAIYRPLIQKFWPGPLTIILPVPPPDAYAGEEHGEEEKDDDDDNDDGNGSGSGGDAPFGWRLAPEVTAGLGTFGARMPASPLALALIQQAGVPLAAPSANASGRPSPTAAAHVRDDLGGRVALVLDGGPCAVGVESTVVDGLCRPPCVLRPGGVALAQLRRCRGWEGVVVAYRDEPSGAEPEPRSASAEEGGEEKEGREKGDRDGKAEKEKEDKEEREKEPPPRAPGMKYRHYSPRAKVVLYAAGWPLPSPEHISRLLLHHQPLLFPLLPPSRLSGGPAPSVGVIRTRRWLAQSFATSGGGDGGGDGGTDGPMDHQPSANAPNGLPYPSHNHNHGDSDNLSHNHNHDHQHHHHPGQNTLPYFSHYVLPTARLITVDAAPALPSLSLSRSYSATAAATTAAAAESSSPASLSNGGVGSGNARRTFDAVAEPAAINSAGSGDAHPTAADVTPFPSSSPLSSSPAPASPAPASASLSTLTIWDIPLGPSTTAVARGIFAALRELDRKGVDVILVEGLSLGSKASRNDNSNSTTTTTTSTTTNQNVPVNNGGGDNDNSNGVRRQHDTGQHVRDASGGDDCGDDDDGNEDDSDADDDSEDDNNLAAAVMNRLRKAATLVMPLL